MKHPAWLVASLFGVALAAPTRIDVGQFSSAGLDAWQARSFSAETSYQLVELEGARVLRAHSRASASGLFLERRIDLRQTPWLNWSWRVENTLGTIDERSRDGDDYAARVYVIVDGGLAFWRSRAVNYVWSSNQAIGTQWPNAFVGDKAMMLALRSGEAEAGRWQSERRNVRADFARLFGTAIDRIDAIAIMSDTDNSGAAATAYYGDIWFSAD